MDTPTSRPSEDDLYATLRAAIAELAARDPEAQRFGARHHRYRAGRPITEARIAAIEAEANVRLPDDYRQHLLALGDGGAGPYYGLLPLDHPIQRALLPGVFPYVHGAAPPPPENLSPSSSSPWSGGDGDRRPRRSPSIEEEPGGERLGGSSPSPWQGVVGVGHLGCGYTALLVVTGPARGQIWLDARSSDVGVIPIYPSFAIYVADWITRRAHAQWLAPHIPAGVCALPAALSSYFHQLEQKQGLAPGALEGDALRAAIASIDVGGIATTQDVPTPFFAAGDRLDLCVACELLADNLGMNRACFVPGVEPIPARDRTE
ncbi:MAG: SMI1/KNR4 family protein [Deltaproteobacteria bacterium]|nr:SMI1/KNR4 family protein [Deltaproteobacteria bacterium]